METHTEINLKFDRKPLTLEKYSLSSSTFYLKIKEGLIPPPISLGERAVAWLAHETDIVISAMVAGKNKEELKNIVSSLVRTRPQIIQLKMATLSSVLELRHE